MLSHLAFREIQILNIEWAVVNSPMVEYSHARPTTLSSLVIYRIAGMFGGGKVWQIWRVIRDSPNFNQPNFS